MRTPRYAILLFLAVLATGCKPDYPSCRDDEDCKSDPKEYCVDQKCQQCRNDKDCPTGQACKAGRCEAARKSCSDDTQCPAGQSCIGGSCAPCRSDGECGPGGRCNSGRCQRAKRCSSDNDCAQDEECKNGFCISGRSSASTGHCALDPAYFDFNESAVTTEGSATLQRDADCLKKDKGAVSVIGHTDPRGTDEYNLALSDRRAQSVKTYLGRLGVDASRLQTQARGETDATGADESGWARDRRVDFQWK